LGFFAGFAQGFSEAQDKKEARRQYEDALALKKKEMLLATSVRRAELGLSNDGGRSGIDAYSKSLAKMGVDEEAIARLAQDGGVQGLKQVYETVTKAYDPSNPWTPEEINSIVENTVISGGGAADVGAMAAEAGVTLDATEKDYFSVMGQSAPTVVMPLPPKSRATKTASLNDINLVRSMAEKNLGAALEARKAQVNAELATLTGTEAEAKATEANELTAIMAELKAGNAAPAISIVGAEAIRPYIQSPEFEGVSFGGAWDTALQTPALETTTPEPSAAPAGYTDLKVDFATEEEADKAIADGRIPPRSIFTIAGKPAHRK